MTVRFRVFFLSQFESINLFLDTMFYKTTCALTINPFTGQDPLTVIVLDLFHFCDEVGALDECVGGISACEYDFHLFGAVVQRFEDLVGLDEAVMEGDEDFIQNDDVVDARVQLCHACFEGQRSCVDIGLFRILADEAASAELLDFDGGQDVDNRRFTILHVLDELSDVDFLACASGP